jgi:hypothetical protein
MVMRVVTRAALFVITSTLVGAGGPSATLAQSEETEINAFSVVRGKGVGLKSADKAVTFTGTLEGFFFVDGGEGPVKAGTLVCSAALDIKTEDRSHNGSGRCLITAEEGGEVFGQYICAGYFLVGCSGTFTLTGGSGRFAGITGSGPMTLRTGIAKLISGTTGSQSIETEGVLVWREFKYKLP